MGNAGFCPSTVVLEPPCRRTKTSSPKAPATRYLCIGASGRFCLNMETSDPPFLLIGPLPKPYTLKHPKPQAYLLKHLYLHKKEPFRTSGGPRFGHGIFLDLGLEAVL